MCGRDEQSGGGPPPERRTSRRFSRRELLALGAAGASALTFGGGVAFGQQSRAAAQAADAPEEHYKGHKIKVKEEKGRQELYVDDARITTIQTNGAFRAEGYMFDPQGDIKRLAKAMIDAHEKLKAKGVQTTGIL